MRFDVTISASELLDALGTSDEFAAQILDTMGLRPSEMLDLKVDVDRDEAFDAVEAEGMIPEPDLEELLEFEDLVEAVTASLKGDRTSAIHLFGRAFESMPQARRRIEELFYARSAPGAGQPLLPLTA